jgi:hypothetical protein
MVLHPGKYWDDRRFDRAQQGEYLVTSLPEGWKLLRQDTLGELLCAIVASRPSRRGGIDMTKPGALASVQFSNAAAQGWDGDRVVLVGSGPARVLQWTTVWDTPEDAQQFLDALNAQFDDLENSVALLTGDRELAYGVVMQAGAKSDEIVFTVYHTVPHAQLNALSAALGFYRPKQH